MRDEKGKVVAKGNLPHKMCLECARPFNWRKKWERCWDEIRFCSEACKAKGKKTVAVGATAPDVEIAQKRGRKGRS